MQKPLFPLSQIRNLKCRHCQKFINCGPVYVVPDTSVLCGRCRMLAKDIYRNHAYEAIASIFRYPCTHWENHCPISLQWNESITHEDKCGYKGGCSLFWKHPGACFKGKREIIDSFSDVRLTPVPEYLLGHIKCVLCESYLSCEPVFIQTNGRNICHRCISSNGLPPHCLRNIAYETISKIIVFPCIYRNRGCPTRLQFGRDLWQHETVCPYGQSFQRISKSPSVKKEKERGVIQTHSGHMWGTITPHSQLFAPPSANANDINREVIKSLVKKQERKIKRADDLSFTMNSEDGTASSASSYNNDRGTPEKLIPDASSPFRIMDEQSGHFTRLSSQNSSDKNHSRYTTPDIIPNTPSEKEVFMPFPQTNSSVRESGSLTANDLQKHDSLLGLKDVIKELKHKQSIIKQSNSFRGKQDLKSDPSPYKQCQNLEDILLVHDKLK